MRITHLLLAASILIGLVGCKDDAGTTPTVGGASPSMADGIKKTAEGVADAAKKAADDAASKAGEMAASAREEAAKAANATLDGLRTQIDAMSAKAADLDPLKKAAFEPAMKAVETQWAEAKKAAASIATSENWEAARAQLDKALEGLKSGLANAMKIAGG